MPGGQSLQARAARRGGGGGGYSARKAGGGVENTRPGPQGAGSGLARQPSKPNLYAVAASSPQRGNSQSPPWTGGKWA